MNTFLHRTLSRYTRRTMSEKKSIVQKIVGDEPVNLNIEFSKEADQTIKLLGITIGSALVINGVFHYLK